jgi:ferredoxin
MARFKVELIREECTGCGSCVDSCPDYWEMADDGLAHLKGSTTVGDNEALEMDALGCNKDAAEVCPVTCIHIYEGANKIT